MLDSSYQVVKGLFVFAYNNIDGDTNHVDVDSFKKYLIPRVKIITLILMEEIFMINQLMTQLNNTTRSEKYQ